MDGEFVITAWPPNRGVYAGVPLEYIPDGGFSDMDGMTTCITGMPERLKADTAILATHDSGLTDLIYYKDSSDNTYLVTHRASPAGLYYYDSGWTKIRGGSLVTNPDHCVFAQMNDKLFIAGFNDGDGSLGSELQMWDGTNYRVPRISTPNGIGYSGYCAGDMEDNKYYGVTYTYVDSDGNEGPSATRSVILLTTANGGVDLVGITTGPSVEGISKRKIYRTLAQDTGAAAGDATRYYLTEIDDNTTTTYTMTEHDDELDLNLAAPEYASGWPSGVTPKGVMAYGGRIYAWTTDTVYVSGRPPALNSDDVLARASDKYGLYEHLYFQEDYARHPGYDGDQIVRCVGWRGNVYAFKRNSIWLYDQRSLSPEAWKFTKVADIGASTASCIAPTYDGIYFLRAVGVKEGTLWRIDASHSPELLSGNVLFDALPVSFGSPVTGDPAGAIYEFEGVIWVNGTGGTVWGYNPSTRQWSKHDDKNHLYAAESMWDDTPEVYYIAYDSTNNYQLRKRSETIRHAETACLGDGYCTTGNMVAKIPDRPKRFNKLSFQVSTDGDITVTVTGYTDVASGGTQIYSGVINNTGGELVDVLIPQAIVRGRWLKLKFAFSGTGWARLDGFTVYGRYDPPRNN